jgi:hypothetical protein
VFCVMRIILMCVFDDISNRVAGFKKSPAPEAAGHLRQRLQASATELLVLKIFHLRQRLQASATELLEQGNTVQCDNDVVM